MDHGVGVFDAAAVGASVLFQDFHEVVVVVALGPVALPFEEGGDGGEADSACLHHAGEGGIVRGLGGGSAAVFDYVEVVAFAKHFDGGPGDADLCPKAGHYDVFLACGFDGGAEGGVVPRVHARAFDGLLAREDIEELRPEVAAKAFGFNGGEDSGDVELFCDFGEEDDVVDEGGAVNIGDAEGHLRLVVDEDDGGIVCGEQFVIVGHDGVLLWVR